MRTSIRDAKPNLVAVCLLVFAGWADVTFNPGGSDAGLINHSSLKGTPGCVRAVTTPQHGNRASAASCKRHDGQTRNEFLLAAAAPAYRLRFAESMDYGVASANNDSAIYLFSTRGPPVS
jgi:hypothetical protein